MPKALVEVGGRTLLEHAIDRALASGIVDEIVVVTPPAAPAVIMQSRYSQVRTVPGGATRQASVQCGLAALGPDVDVVLVHDAARCFAPPELFARVAAAVDGDVRAVVPAVQVTDTVRALDGGVVDRSRLRAVQTPQGFDREVLVRAHEQAAAAATDEATAATDDAGLVERLGVTVHLVEGDPLAFKVTTPQDLLLAEAVLASGAGS